MKTIFRLVFFCLICAAADAAVSIRQPEKTAWTMDLTDSCIRDSRIRMTDHLSRERRTVCDDAGTLFRWSLSVDAPKRNAPHGLLLEFDNGDVVESLKINGQPAVLFPVKKPFWPGAERAALLPDAEQYQIEFRVRNLISLYPNAFGRLSLRPATINDVFVLERDPREQGKITLRNRGWKTERTILHAASTDFFGVPLSEERFTLELKPGERKAVRIRIVPHRWVTEYRLEQGDQRSWSWRDYPRPDQWFPERAEAVPILSGWEKQPGGSSAERGPLPGNGWKTAGKFPLMLDPKQEKSHFLWLRTRVTVPKEWTGKELYLAFPMVHFKADLFLNGTERGSVFLWNTPSRIRISDWVRAGESFELALCITDYTAALLKGTKMPEAGIYGAPSRSLTAAVGHFPAGGIPGLKSPPELLALSPVRTDHVAIRSTVTGGPRLDVDFELRNETPGGQDVRMEWEVLRQGRRIFQIPPEPLRLNAGETRRIRRSRTWTDPEFWTPETPVLYELRTTLRDSAGKILDLRRERFGFRELGIRGNHFTLNGDPVRFYGFSQTTPKTMTWPFVPQPLTMFRYHFHDDGYYMGGIGHVRIGDELGIFSKAENLSHNAHHGERFAYQDPVTWERLYGEMSHVIRAVCNAPSIAFWDIGNENKFSAPGESEKMGALFRRISELDPTRHVTISGGHPLPKGDAVRLLDTHGWCDISAETWFFLHPEKRPENRKNSGRYNFIPSGEAPARWDEGRSFSSAFDTHSYKSNLLHFRNLPVFFSESMYLHAHYLPGLHGESIYTPGVSRTYQLNPNLSGRRWMLRMTRRADVAATLGHVARFHGRECAPLAAFSSDFRLRFRSGERLILPFDLYNQTSRADRIRIRLTLRENGKTAAVRERQLLLGPYAKQSLAFDFGELRAETEDRRFDLLVSVEGRYGAAFEDWEEISLYKPERFDGKTTPVPDVLDPSGILSRWMTEKGIRHHRLASSGDWKGGECAWLVVGPDALRDGAEIRQLAKTLRKGGAILVLEHDELPDLTAGALTNLKYGSVGVYPRFLPESPLYGIMMPADLRFWNTKDHDFLTVGRMIKLPSKGNFRILAEGAYEDGIKSMSTALLDYGVGKGVVRYSQFNLARSLGSEPAADRLLAALLTRPPLPFGAPGRAVLAGTEGRRILSGRSGVAEFASSFQNLRLSTLRSLVCDRESFSALPASDLTRLRQWFADGGELLLLNADSSCSAAMETLCGTAVRFPPFALDRARLIRQEKSTRGISSGDFFWNAGKSGTNRAIRWIREEKGGKASASDPGHVVVECSAAQPLTRPAYLSEIRIGKGRITVSTLRLFESPTPEAERLLSSLLSNAGVLLDPGRASAGSDPDRETRTGWTYSPVPLAKFCNRGFRDDPDAPVRGWSAQGPDDDLSALPVGRQVMRGVTFEIVDPKRNGGKSLIALSGTKEIGVLPERVKDIPVGRRHERLVFLYGSAWGAPQFTIRINYIDRKSWIPGAPDPFVELTMRPKLEIDDWYMADTYLEGGGSMPRAKLAWAGYTAASRRRDRHVGLFLYEWDNPYPEKIIDSIDILSPGRKGSGQLFLIALSGADRKKQIPLKQLLPDDSARNLLKRMEYSNYGLLLDKNGSIPQLYRLRDSRPLFAGRRWIVQGRSSRDGKIRHTHLEGAPRTFRIEQESERAVTLRAQTDYLEVKESLTLEETTLLLEYRFRIRKNPPEGMDASLILSFYPIGGEFGNLVNTNPLLIDWKEFSGSLAFPPEYRWHRGYYGSKKAVAFTPFPNGTFRAGNEAKLTLRLNLP